MKRDFADITAMLVVALAVIGCAQHSSSQGWITLIDGAAGMENWNITGGANWRAEDGAIQADKSTTQGASVLVSKKSFKNFELYAEFWASEDTNSGIYLRAMKPAAVSTASGAYEVQIWDKNPNPDYSTGSLVNVATVKPIYKAGGRWNTYEIFAKGPEITVKLNGVVTVSAKDGRFPEGRIGLNSTAARSSFANCSSKSSDKSWAKAGARDLKCATAVVLVCASPLWRRWRRCRCFPGRRPTPRARCAWWWIPPGSPMTRLGA